MAVLVLAAAAPLLVAIPTAAPAQTASEDARAGTNFKDAKGNYAPNLNAFDKSFDSLNAQYKALVAKIDKTPCPTPAQIAQFLQQIRGLLAVEDVLSNDLIIMSQAVVRPGVFYINKGQFDGRDRVLQQINLGLVSQRSILKRCALADPPKTMAPPPASAGAHVPATPARPVETVSSPALPKPSYAPDVKPTYAPPPAPKPAATPLPTGIRAAPLVEAKPTLAAPSSPYSLKPGAPASTACPAGMKATIVGSKTICALAVPGAH